MQPRSLISSFPPARGDTFVMAEDDDEGELFEATTPSSPPANSRRVGPTQLPASDFRLNPHQETSVTLEMTKPPGLVQQSSPDEKVTEPSPIDPQTTTVPATPDPDAVVCSGRPFDSFMQVKNGSIFAFRGKLYTLRSQMCVGVHLHHLFLFLRGVFL